MIESMPDAVAGGHPRVESEKGAGTTVIIDLPQAE